MASALINRFKKAVSFKSRHNPPSKPAESDGREEEGRGRVAVRTKHSAQEGEDASRERQQERADPVGCPDSPDDADPSKREYRGSIRQKKKAAAKKDARKEEKTKEEETSVRKKKIQAMINKKKATRKQTTTEEIPETEEKKDADEKNKSKEVSERKTNPVAETVKSLLASGRVDTTGEEVKTAMRNFAVRSSSLLAPGALQEYVQSVKMYIPEDTTREAFDKNPSKNRYKDVVCADRDRVILAQGDCDYIHANHVKGSPLLDAQHFICTQNTVADFWRMCRQESVTAIVMLCETKEQGKDKCHQYWSEKDGETMKIEGTEITVTTKGKCVHEGVGVTTTHLVVREKGGEDQNVQHHQWKTWPDKGVPESFETVLRLLQMIRKTDGKSASVIHCSAGIGRTGTVVAVEMCLQRLLQGRPLEVLSVVKNLRAKRMHCVQTDLQYVFVYRVLIGFLSMQSPDAETKQAVEEFVTSYTKLIESRAQPVEAYAPIQFGP
ncbi:hypothetical protein L596_008006 [Steinernema carpocapsae]|uniref:Tyrosine-protein phosphatase domain-containing protein n=1 Tax=Steinernema carpocapsae TaxID=34508 RepID=A0A4U5PB88_STECR|nr:hypothetical protein L596_008006 [Steinernema carpocapsae]